MLVITREREGEVVIGDPASPIGSVYIVDIRGDRVRLGFKFPRDIAINRREIADKIIETHEAQVAESEAA